jgi:hypothetical protein
VKLITSLDKRRDGSLPKIETTSGGRGNKSAQIIADADGVYDVPDALGESLIATGNFSDADAKEDSKEPDESTQVNADTTNILVNADGDSLDLDGMTKVELAAFALENFGLEFKQNDTKPVLIAAILAEAAKPAKTEDESE